MEIPTALVEAQTVLKPLWKNMPLPDDLPISILYNPAVLHLGSIPREIHTTMFKYTNACLQQR